MKRACVAVILSVVLAAIGGVFPCWAAKEAVVFARDVITILPEAKEENVETPPTKSDKEETAPDLPERKRLRDNPAISRGVHRLSVDIRHGQAAPGQGIFIRAPLNDTSGTLFVLEKAGLTPLSASTTYHPVDVLFIAEDGVIQQILPMVKLAEITQPIEPSAPVKAFLHLKAGITQQWDIRPGDRVEHVIFKTNPVILQ